MSKKKTKKKKEIVKELTAPMPEQSKGFYENGFLHKILIFVFAIGLYANTITHEYTQDDAIVIYDNMFTTQGIAGIPGLLSNDTFFGFFKEEGKANLVSGGRYRPLTPVMFAIEWQIFGKNPLMSHLFSILLYALLCVILYKCLELVFLNDKKSKYSRLMVLGAVLLFTAHPIHTEVVANIKGRDEIMSLMGALLALFYSVKYYDSKKSKYLVFVFLSFFLGLMSKENAITFLAIIPLAILFFRKSTLSQSLKSLGPILGATLVFMVIRFMILGFDFGASSPELMNNPYLKVEGNRFVPFTGGEKIATIIFTLGKYIQLLFFPHPLTHDYYPRHIEIMSFGNWQVILSLFAYLGMIAGIFYYWTKNKIISFSLFYFIATLSIVSNIVFPIGTNMSERFMFMPSIGFALFLSYIIESFTAKKGKTVLMLVGLGIFILGFSLKTITRNLVWENDYTLFTTDVKTSTRSAKMLNAAGGAISTKYYKEPDSPEKTKALEQAIVYLKGAIDIHPRYKNAFLLLGNAHNFLKKYPESIKYYEQALDIDSGYRDAYTNLAVTLRDAGRHYGEKLNQIDQAEKYLKRSYSMTKDDYETVRLLGITSGIKGDHSAAIKYFEEALKFNPDNKILKAQTFSSLGTAYRNYGDEEMARINFQKALELDPNIFNNLKK